MILCSRNYSAKGIFEKRFVGFWCTNEDFPRMNITQHVVGSEARKWTLEGLSCPEDSSIVSKQKQSHAKIQSVVQSLKQIIEDCGPLFTKTRANSMSLSNQVVSP